MADEDWDIETYYNVFEPEEQWEMKKKFMETYKHMFDQHRLVCLAQVLVNIEFLGCRYPPDTMRQIAELSHGFIEEFRERQKSRLKRTFVGAADAASAKVKGTKSAMFNTFQEHKSSNSMPLEASDGGRRAMGDQNVMNTKEVGRMGRNMKTGVGTTSEINRRCKSVNHQIVDGPVFKKRFELPKEKVATAIETIITNKSASEHRTVVEAVSANDEAKEEPHAQDNSKPIVKKKRKKKTTVQVVEEVVVEDEAEPIVKKQKKKKTIVQAAEEVVEDEAEPVAKKKRKTTVEVQEEVVVEDEAEPIVKKKKKRKTTVEAGKVSQTSTNSSDVLKIKQGGGSCEEQESVENQKLVDGTEDKTGTGVEKKKKKRKKKKKTKTESGGSEATDSIAQVRSENLEVSPGAVVFNYRLPDFVLVIRENKSRWNDQQKWQEAQTILASSASVNQLKYSCTRLKNPDGMWECTVIMGETAIVKAVHENEEESSQMAKVTALNALKKTQYSVMFKDLRQDGELITIGESKNQEQLTESNMGFKLLKMMGWTGGGLGLNQQGIVNPIEQSTVVGRAGLGSQNTKASFEADIRRYLANYSRSDSVRDLVFSTEYSNEERKLIHLVARAHGLQSKSHTMVDESGNKLRQLIVGRRAMNSQKLIELVRKKMGDKTALESCKIGEKIEIIPPSS